MTTRAFLVDARLGDAGVRFYEFLFCGELPDRAFALVVQYWWDDH